MSVHITVKVAADTQAFRTALAERGEEFVTIAERAKSQGAKHHQFGIGPDYVLVIDEWDSAEQFEAFFGSAELQAFMPTIGGDPNTPPEITVAEAVDSADRF